MAYDVKFLRGTSTQYLNVTPDLKTFYFLTDTNQLYLGNVKLSDGPELAAAIARIAQNETDIKAIQDQLKEMFGEGSGSVKDMIDAAIQELADELNPKIAENTRLIGVNEQAIAKNAEDIGKNAEAIAENTRLIGVNDAAIKENTRLIGVNAQAIADLAAEHATDKEALAGQIGAVQQTANDNAAAIAILNGNAETTGSVAHAVAAAKTELSGEIDAVEVDMGDVDALSTQNKTVVGAINEVLTAVGTGGTAAVVTMTSNTTTEGMLKSYTIKQGDSTVGVIDIPKDMVVESGSVVTNPEGQEEGTYIKLVLANVAEPLFINVGHLVDLYTVKASAAQVQLALSDDRELSASIVAGSISATELAANAVVTEKIADSNVTKAKLSTEVQGLLDGAATKTYVDETFATKAESEKGDSDTLAAANLYADQEIAKEKERAEGIENGLNSRLQTVETKLGDGEGSVHAEIEAAKQAAIDAAATDAKNKADAAEAAALAAAKEWVKAGITTGSANGTIAVDGVDVAVKGLGTAAYKNEGDFDAFGAAAQALVDAKAYVDEALTWGEIK